MLFMLILFKWRGAFTYSFGFLLLNWDFPVFQSVSWHLFYISDKNLLVPQDSSWTWGKAPTSKWNFSVCESFQPSYVGPEELENKYSWEESRFVRTWLAILGKESTFPMASGAHSMWNMTVFRRAKLKFIAGSFIWLENECVILF